MNLRFLWLIASAMACAPAAATPHATRWVCTLVDGTTRIVADNLQEQFGQLASDCRAFDVTPAAIQPMPVRPLAPRHASLMRGRHAGTKGRPLPALMPSAHAQAIREAARRNQLNPRLLMAVIQVESRHQSDARSNKGALGLMQIMPETGARYGVSQSRNLYDPEVNIDVGARYLSDLLDMFGSVELAVAAFNAGEAAVLRYDGVPPYPETRRYVHHVMALLGGSHAGRVAIR